MAEVLVADADGHSLINLDDVDQLLDCLGLIEEVHVLTGLGKNLLPLRVREAEKVLDVVLLAGLFCGDHVTNAFVYHEFLVVLKVLAIFRNHRDQFDDIWLLVVGLVLLSEHMLSKLRNLQESFCSHILHPWVLLVHELVQLLDDCLQERPMFVKEIWKLSHNIHDI